jgi:hypothetical protein
MALGFDYGDMQPAAIETVTVVTRIQSTPPVDAGDETPLAGAPRLRVLGSMPFRTELRMRLDLPRDGDVRVEVFDVRGRRVRRLLDGRMAAGSHPVRWDALDDRGTTLGAGLYFVRLRSAAGPQSLRVVHLP